MSNRYEKMYLISEEEYNMRGPLSLTLPTYKTPDQKAEERDFKALGKNENRAKQLYDTIIKYSRVNDKNEWYEKRDDTLPVAGTNIIDLITYAIKGAGKEPYGWNYFFEFLKTNESIPRSLLSKVVRDKLELLPIIPTVAPSSISAASTPTVSVPTPVTTTAPTSSTVTAPSPSSVKENAKAAERHKRRARGVPLVATPTSLKKILKESNQKDKGLKIYF